MGMAWRRALAAAVPGRCAVCGAWPAEPLCPACRACFARAEPRCLRCALPLPEGGICGACLREPPPLAACLAAVRYAYPWSGLLARFKFRAEPGWAPLLARVLRDAPGVGDALAQADLLLPVPLAAARLAQRGYNQAVLLARALAPARTRTGLLLRLRDTPAQAGLPRAQREANLRGAFALEPLRRAEVRRARILLVDDVMTSGATLQAAAQPLHDAGAAQVGALVLARTDPPA